MASPQCELRDGDLHAALRALGDIADAADSELHLAQSGARVLSGLVNSDLTRLSRRNLHGAKRSVIGVRPGSLDTLHARRQRAPALDRGTPDRFDLTPREREVLRWVPAGKTDAGAAVQLGCSPRTVHKHLQHAYVKLDVETRTATVMRGAAGRLR